MSTLTGAREEEIEGGSREDVGDGGDGRRW